MQRHEDEWGVGSLLRAHRQAAGMTQQRLAEQAGLSARGIQDLENGRSAPRRETLVRLIAALHLRDDQRQTIEARVLARPRRSQPHGAPRDPTGHSIPNHNVPRQLSSFVGRAHELDDLEAHFDQAPLLTLVGTGGVGKTRIAFELAARWLPRAVDGVWLVELASLADPDLVPQHVAATFGIVERARWSQLDGLIDGLRPQRVMLVLDNCEHLVDACAALVQVLMRACPRLRVLATSREPLGLDGEHVWTVLPLSLTSDGLGSTSEAEQLFIERARTNVSGFTLTEPDAAAVREICARLDGIPLAIELAAARVRTLTPAQIASRVHDRFRLLVSGRRDAPPS